jgi:RNA polymerase sigma-70 factor (ECF subfamily)
MVPMALAWTMEMPLQAAPPAGVDEEGRLVADSVSGDPDAFAALVRMHQRRVFRLVGRFFRRPEDIEDAAQDTFLTAWKKLATYRATAPFEHWLTRVCLNCCYEKLRKRKPVELPLLLDGDPAAPQAAPEAALEVERLLRTLPPRDRFILLLLDGEGWSVAEIAERLGWTRVNVKVRAHRARKKLRELLERGLEK